MVRAAAFAAVVAATVLLPSRPLHAYFAPGYSDWQSWSAAMRNGFVMGTIDQIVNGGSEREAMAWTASVSICIGGRLQATSGMIAQAVTDAYRANPDLWNISAVAMLNYVVVRMCEPELNRSLGVIGLPPVSAGAHLASMRRLARITAEQAPVQQPQQQSSRRR